MKRAWLWIILLIVVLVAAGAGVWYFYRPQADITTCSTVAVFDLANFADGASACLVVGDYPNNETMGIGNDKIASIKIYPGYKATVYVSDNYGAPSLEVTTDLKNLDNVASGFVAKWDDKISSIKVEKAPACVATVYDTANFGGYGTCLAVGDYTAAALLAKNIANDKISSVKVNSGYKVTAYMDNDFKGRLKDFTADVSNLTSVLTSEKIGIPPTWNDQISSLKVAAVTTEPVTPEPTTPEPTPVATTTTTTTDTTPVATTATTPTTTASTTPSTTTSSTTTTTDTTPVATTTTPSTITATTTRPASTGPETPLVAGGLLSLVLGAYYLIERRLE